MSLSLQTYTMVHELGHAVGMRHQHQTPDRDQYINIHWENIDEKVNLKQSFGIVNDPSLYDQSLLKAIPYDIDSIMHYPSNVSSSTLQFSLYKSQLAKLPFLL